MLGIELGVRVVHVFDLIESLVHPVNPQWKFVQITLSDNVKNLWMVGCVEENKKKVYVS
jgi:hypothetical protein